MTRRKAMMKAVNPSHQRINTFPMSWHPYRSFRQMQTLLAPWRETTKAHSHTTDPVVACYGHAKHARRRQSQWTVEKQLRWEKGEDYARYTLSPMRTAVTLRPAFFWDITQRMVVIPYRRFGTNYRSHLQGSKIKKERFLTTEDRTDRMSRNVGKKLPLYSA